MVMRKVSKHISWPNRPPGDEAEGTLQGFLARCYDISTYHGRRGLFKYVKGQYERYSEKTLSGEEDDELRLQTAKLQIGLWLARCQKEDNEEEITPEFWQHYDAAMGGQVENLNPILRDIFLCYHSVARNNYLKKEKEMAIVKKVKKVVEAVEQAEEEIAAPTKKPAKKAAPAPVKTAKKAKAQKAETESGYRAGSLRDTAYSVCLGAKNNADAVKRLTAKSIRLSFLRLMLKEHSKAMAHLIA